MKQAELVDDLSEVVRSSDALVIVGSGLSVEASDAHPTSDWRGLVAHGVKRCETLDQGLPADWAKRQMAELQSSDLDDLISVAEKVRSKITAHSEGEWRRWLRETVGSLPALKTKPIEAIDRLNLPIVTTNYDGLIESATRRSAISHSNHHEAEEVVRGNLDHVLHIHGFWKNANDVILGVSDYTRFLGEEHSQSLLKAMRLTKSVIFVGFGSGLQDPTFSALSAWSSAALEQSERRSYQLVLDRDTASVQAYHRPGGRIFALGCGRDFASYWTFVNSLGDSNSADSAERPIVDGQHQRSPEENPRDGRAASRAAALRDGVFSLPRFDSVPRPQVESQVIERIATDSLVSVEGLSGSGKTYVAARSLSDLARPVIWYNPRPESAFEDFIAYFATVLEINTIGPLNRAREVLNYLNETNTILVVDDLSDTLMESWRTFLSEASNCAPPASVLVVSRRDVRTWSDVRAIRVPPLGETEALQLLEERGARVAPSVVADLIAKTDGLAMAISIFGTLVARGHDPSELLTEGVSTLERLQLWLGSLFGALSATAKTIAEVYSQLGIPFSSRSVSRIADSLGIRDPQAGLVELSEHFIVEHVGDSRWRMHSLIASAVKSRLDPEIAYNYVRLLAENQLSGTPLPSRPAKSDEDLRRGISAATLYLSIGEYRDANMLLDRVAAQAKRSGNYQLLADVGQNALHQLASRDRWLSYHVAHCFLVLGEPRRGLAILGRDSAGSDEVLRLSRSRLAAELEYELGFTTKSLKRLEGALHRANDVNLMEDRRSATAFDQARLAAAQLAVAQGDQQLALRYVLEVGDNTWRRGISTAKSEMILGQLRLHESQVTLAAQHFEEALSIFERLHDRRGMAWAYLYVALAAYRSPSLSEDERDKLVERAIALHERLSISSRDYNDVLQVCHPLIEQPKVRARAAAARRRLGQLPHLG